MCATFDDSLIKKNASFNLKDGCFYVSPKMFMA